MMGELIHDLSNEITVLQGWALLARGEVDAGRLAGSEVDRVLEISSSVGQMLRDMLETVGGRGLSPEVTFDPLALTEETLAQRIRELSGLTVRLHSMLAPGVRIAGRSSFWSRSLGNLLSNAARYARREIVVSLLEQGTEDGTMVLLRVEDDGPGVEPGVRESIFRPFSRGEDGDMGLGLSSAVWAVTQLGGEIGYREGSALGGASFEMRVPAARPVVQRARPARVEQGESLRGLRIALVDDDPAVRRALTRLLRRSGAEVTELLPESDAELLLLHRLEEADPQLILLDLRMGGQGGLSLWNRMCLEAPELAGRVIFMSGAAPGDPDWEQARHTGQPSISKPFELGRLAELVRAFRATG